MTILPMILDKYVFKCGDPIDHIHHWIKLWENLSINSSITGFEPNQRHILLFEYSFYTDVTLKKKVHFVNFIIIIIMHEYQKMPIEQWFWLHVSHLNLVNNFLLLQFLLSFIGLNIISEFWIQNNCFELKIHTNFVAIFIKHRLNT